MSHDREPLTPEERALADRLAGATPRREPPPAVDAAILARAREAVAPAAARARPRRWPAMLGVAASLALAVGIAWQLRPAPEQALPVVTEAPPPPSTATAARRESADQAAAGRADPAREAEAAISDVPAAQSEPAPAQTSPAPVASEHKAAPAPAREPSAPGLAEQASPHPASPRPAAEPDDAAAAQREMAPEMRTGHRLPPAPPAPPAPAPVADVASPASKPAGPPERTLEFVPSPPPAETAVGHERVRQGAPARPAAVRARAIAAPAPAPVPKAADDVVFDRQELHDEPPATVDSPEVHRAWLERIRELRDAGDIEAARENLREYRRRHPDQPLPDDLEDLLDE